MAADQKPSNIEREQETQRWHREAALPGGRAALPGGRAGRESQRAGAGYLCFEKGVSHNLSEQNLLPWPTCGDEKEKGVAGFPFPTNTQAFSRPVPLHTFCCGLPAAGDIHDGKHRYRIQKLHSCLITPC